MVQDLPPCRPVIVRVMQTVNDPSTSGFRPQPLISADQTRRRKLTWSALRMVSAQKIATIANAVVIPGVLATVPELTTSLGVFNAANANVDENGTQP